MVKLASKHETKSTYGTDSNAFSGFRYWDRCGRAQPGQSPTNSVTDQFLGLVGAPLAACRWAVFTYGYPTRRSDDILKLRPSNRRTSYSPSRQDGQSYVKRIAITRDSGIQLRSRWNTCMPLRCVTAGITHRQTELLATTEPTPSRCHNFKDSFSQLTAYRRESNALSNLRLADNRVRLKRTKAKILCAKNRG